MALTHIRRCDSDFIKTLATFRLYWESNYVVPKLIQVTYYLVSFRFSHHCAECKNFHVCPNCFKPHSSPLHKHLLYRADWRQVYVREMVSGDVITVVQFTQVPEITRQGIAKHVNMICVTSARIRKWKVSSTGADKDKPFVRLNVLG